MDKALKQRLVGASVLIALAVIVLPMLLGGRTEPGQQSSEQIELPARPEGTAFETRRFPLGKEPTAVPVPDTGQLPEASALDVAAESQPSTDGTPALTATGNTGQETADTTESGDAPATTENLNPGTESLPPVASVEIPETGKVDLPVEGVAASFGTSAAATTKTVSNGRYAVQVASLASATNAKKLRSELEAKGFTVISDFIESDVGRLSRIRVGPFASEVDAAAAVKKIQSQVEGVTPRMVDLDPAAAQTLNPSDPLVRWVVQLGSFGESSNAENLVKQVRAQGLSAYSEKVTSSSGSAINRVRVGPYLQREDASKAQQGLKFSLGINGVVMSAD